MEVLKSKIHRAVITEANLHYVGSLTLDEDRMDAANFFENEKVQIIDVNNSERLETYLIKGKPWKRHSLFKWSCIKERCGRRYRSYYFFCNNGF